jgi:methionyl-tRNA formyltransferase
MTSPLRLVFLGSDAIARPLLDWLVSEVGRSQVEVVGVFTQPDRPVGRGQKITANTIKTWALARDLPIFQPEKITDEVREQLAALTPDLSLVMAYGHILRDAFIGTPRLGTLNLHTSLLPRYRGASPIQTAIANGERQTGVTLMRIVRELDAGPVADVECVKIEPLETAQDIEAKLAAACVPMMARALPRLVDSSLDFTAQDQPSASFCRRLEKSDGALDFTAPAAVLAARINGLFPWPTCGFELNGQSVKIGLADVAPDQAPAISALSSPFLSKVTPGNVLGVDAHGLLVATGLGVLRLRRLQRPGGRMLPSTDFLRGFSVAIGTHLVSMPMPALCGSNPFPRP